MLDGILQHLLGHGIVSGSTAVVVIILILTSAWKLLKWVWPKLVNFVKERYIVTITIESQEITDWVLQWFASQHYADKKKSLLAMLNPKFNLNDRHVAVAGNSKLSENEDFFEGKVFFIPAPGKHIFKFDGNWIMVSQSKNEKKETEDGWARLLIEDKVSLSMIGTDIKKLKDILKKIVDDATTRYSNTLRVLMLNNFNDYAPDKFVRKRLLSSVILEDGMIDNITADVSTFLNKEDWYASMGIPWHRGYLFHGPPGCGKSSLIKALASHFDLDLYVMTLSSKDLDDTKLMRMFCSVRRRSALLIEDIDAAFTKRDAGNNIAITFSGLLNAMDGVATEEGRVLFLTTNYPKLLDNALVRPGRIDVELEIKRATKQQAKTMFEKFYPNEPLLSELLYNRVEDQQISPAELQEAFIVNEGSPSAAIDFIFKKLDSDTK